MYPAKPEVELIGINVMNDAIERGVTVEDAKAQGRNAMELARAGWQAECDKIKAEVIGQVEALRSRASALRQDGDLIIVQSALLDVEADDLEGRLSNG